MMASPIFSSSALRLVALGLSVSACAAGGTGAGGDQGGGGAGGAGTDLGLDPGSCPVGGVVCEGHTAKTCDGDGGTTSEVDCAAQGDVCAPQYGCVKCVPFSPGACANGKATMCDAHGGGMVEFTCDPMQGETCAADGCHGACSPPELGPSYIGCEYWPTVTFNGVLSRWFTFDAVVANANTVPVDVVVTRGEKEVAKVTIAPGSIQAIALPWIKDLKGEDSGSGVLIAKPTASVRSAGGAYRLRSDHPVTAYQFNALSYQNKTAPTSKSCQTQETCCPDPVGAGGCFSYSNDASLLLPTTSLGSDYVATGYRAFVSGLSEMDDFLALTATEDGTQVNVTVPEATVEGGGRKSLTPGQTATITLNAGDVFELLGAGGLSLSGSRLTSANGKRFQLLSGLAAAEIPDGVHAADHIEEIVLPVEALGRDYLVTVPTTPLGKKTESVRIQPVGDQTKLTFDPPSIHAPVTLDAWQTLEMAEVTEDFRVTASAAIGVTQYMHGEGSGVAQPGAAGAGDPSEGLVVPTQQFRTSYSFLAPVDYDQNYVNVAARTGSTITLDGAALDAAEFTPVGSSGMSTARHLLAATAFHEIHGDKPFGIEVYGYGQYTSYMLPGGLDVRRIAAAPPPK